MSASREKKARQEFNASGAVDPKAAREAQERAKQRRSNWLYGGIAIVFVLVAAALLVWNSNVIQRGSAAVTVEGETYSAAEVSYFYHVAYNSIAQNQYASYYGLSTSTPLTQQSLSDMAKTLLGVSEDMTWDAYFKEAAKKSLIQITMLKKGAAEKGITSRVSGDVDLFLVPNIETGNCLGKAIGYFGHCQTAGIVIGAAAPVVMSSRAASIEGKVTSIAWAILACGDEQTEERS